MMQRFVSATTHRSSIARATLSRRLLSGGVHDRKSVWEPYIGTIPRRNTKKPPPRVLGMAPPGSPEAETEIMDSGIVKEVTGEVRMKNYLLATFLLGVVAFNFWYSLHAVGQAGDVGGDDPLSNIKAEAAKAAAAREREARKSDQAEEMLKKFEAGRYDPELEDEEDEAEAANGKKKPWWKVW